MSDRREDLKKRLGDPLRKLQSQIDDLLNEIRSGNEAMRKRIADIENQIAENRVRIANIEQRKLREAEAFDLWPEERTHIGPSSLN